MSPFSVPVRERTGYWPWTQWHVVKPDLLNNKWISKTLPPWPPNSIKPTTWIMWIMHIRGDVFGKSVAPSYWLSWIHAGTWVKVHSSFSAGVTLPSAWYTSKVTRVYVRSTHWLADRKKEQNPLAKHTYRLTTMIVNSSFHWHEMF